MLHTGEWRNSWAVDYGTYRLASRSLHFDESARSYYSNMVMKIISQMKLHSFDTSDPISIFGFLATFKPNCDNNLIHEGAAMWVLHFFCQKRSSANLKQSNFSGKANYTNSRIDKQRRGNNTGKATLLQPRCSELPADEIREWSGYWQNGICNFATFSTGKHDINAVFWRTICKVIWSRRRLRGADSEQCNHRGGRTLHLQQPARVLSKKSTCERDRISITKAIIFWISEKQGSTTDFQQSNPSNSVIGTNTQQTPSKQDHVLPRRVLFAASHCQKVQATPSLSNRHTDLFSNIRTIIFIDAAIISCSRTRNILWSISSHSGLPASPAHTDLCNNKKHTHHHLHWRFHHQPFMNEKYTLLNLIACRAVPCSCVASLPTHQIYVLITFITTTTACSDDHASLRASKMEITGVQKTIYNCCYPWAETQKFDSPQSMIRLWKKLWTERSRPGALVNKNRNPKYHCPALPALRHHEEKSIRSKPEATAL